MREITISMEIDTGNTILDLSATEARDFLLQNKSYCNFDLPHYFNFQPILDISRSIIEHEQSVDKCAKANYSNYDRVNYSVIANKDSNYAWREMQLIHPLLYADLVYEITQVHHWETLKRCFSEHRHSEYISVASLPVIPLNTKKKQTAEQISTWYEHVELVSFELYLKFNYVAFTDITSCYPCLYTHSIAWAVRGIEEEKENIKKPKKERTDTIGNIIDKKIQYMSYGETKGIPQGSLLMDFIAELLLAYIDHLLVERLREYSIKYHIVRYRDDYRIFTDTQQDAEFILKELAELMFRFGFSLNKEKTCIERVSANVAIKKDKLDTILSGLKDKVRTLKTRRLPLIEIKEVLLQILAFSKRYPNSRQLKSLLASFRKKIRGIKMIPRAEAKALISITTEIAYNAPEVYPQATALLSTLMKQLNEDEKSSLLGLILRKFNTLPHVDFLEIWLQRLSLTMPANTQNEPIADICKTVKYGEPCLWNSEWLHEPFRLKIESCPIIEQSKIDTMPFIVSQNEVDCFAPPYDD